VFGSKFVSLVTSPNVTEGQPSQTIQLWDFNQLAIKRAAALGFEREHVRHINDTTVVKDKVFVKTIRTSLPYSITTRTLPPPRSPEEPTFTDAMCGEDTIFLVHVSHPNFTSCPSLTTFFPLQSNRRYLRVLIF
jgi:hypothetical protein